MPLTINKNLVAFLLLAVVFLHVILPPVQAEQQSLGGAIQYRCIAIKQSFGNSSYQNISAVTLPDKLTIIRLNASMESLGQGLFNYTFCNTTQIGQYTVDGIGDVNGNTKQWTYDFEVSALGVQQSTGQAIGSAIFLVLMVVLMFTFGFLGIRLSKSKNWWVLGVFVLFFSILLLVYDTYLGYEYHRAFTGLPNSDLPGTIFYIMLAILVLGTLACLGLFFLRWKEILRYIKREIKKKDDNDEDLEDWDYENWQSGTKLKPGGSTLK